MVTTSPKLNLPLTVPVTGMLAAAASAALTTPSPATLASSVMSMSEPWVSTVKVSGGVGGLVLPAGSVTVAVTVCGPSGSGVVGVKVQLPCGSTTAVPMGTPFSMMVTVSPGVAPPPLKVGLLSSVMPLFGIRPCLVPTSSVASRLFSGLGAWVSTVKGKGSLGRLVLPAGSVAVAVTVCGPSASGAGGVSVQLPLASAGTLPTVVPSTITVTVLPGSALPL